MLNVYLILSGLWKFSAFILLIGSCVYWDCKDGKKDQYCRYCPCVWRVYVFVLVIFGGCYLLCSFEMVIFIFITSIMVYGSFQSYTNPTMSQTLQCSPAIYYSSFMSVTLMYIFVGVIAMITASAYFYKNFLQRTG